MQAVVTGFHAIEECVNAIEKSKKNPQNVKLFYCKVGPRVKKILATANKAGVNSVLVDESKLDQMVQNLPLALQDHRGIVLQKEVQDKKSTFYNRSWYPENIQEAIFEETAHSVNLNIDNLNLSKHQKRDNSYAERLATRFTLK